MIVKLEAEKHQLKLKNESLLLSNSKLQTKLQWSETLQSVERQQVLQPLYLHFLPSVPQKNTHRGPDSHISDTGYLVIPIILCMQSSLLVVYGLLEYFVSFSF